MAKNITKRGDDMIQISKLDEKLNFYNEGEVIVFGTGNMSKIIIKKLKYFNIEIKAFCDSDNKKFGITFVLARVYALIQFLADILIATERSGVLADTLALTAEKMQVLSILSPVVWCWPGCEWDARYGWCGVLIFLICAFAGWSIYAHEKVMNDNQ